jgi:tetratricopeptide (TPR) repeat protein
MKNKSTIYILIVLLLAMLPQIATAQIDDEYFKADQLLRQQKYEQAFEKFYKLHQQNPGTYIFLDKLNECLINLKEYDKAISITKKAANRGNISTRAQIQLGEIYHISGNTQQAFSVWDGILKNNRQNQQVYLEVARSMTDRRAYDKAINTYKQAKEISPDSRMLASELAETYLQAGKYEKSIQEYLQLIKSNPNRMNFVQRRLIRFQDDYIYDVAILEISDFLEDLPQSHPSYSNLQQLEIWLLMERNLFERALVTAKNFESQSSGVTYSLYNLGGDLLAEQKFELAEEAYSYYITNNVVSLKNRSKEELAKVYIAWAKYLENYNLGLSSKRNKLYEKAYSTLESLRTDSPNYRRMNRVLISLSELSLDVLHEPQQASDYLAQLRSRSSDSVQAAQEEYIEGRLHLYDADYTRARISFTRSNKQEGIGNLAEKTRYYLALTDFYSGDYEFARIQLKALQRQNTSYFANDAVQLRLWIQNGLQADSTGKQLDPFAKAIEHFSQGNDQLGIEKLKTLFEDGNTNPLTDEALVELSTFYNSRNAVFVYQTLSRYITQWGQQSPLHERLLWEKARLADQFVTNQDIAVPLPTEPKSDTLSTANQFFKHSQASIPASVEQLIPLYEEILLNFPGGFYATFARERIQELQNQQT